MVQALIPLLLIGVAILLAAMRTRARSRYPVRYELQPAPLSGLDSQESEALSATTSALEALGFRSVGEYATEFQHQSDRQLEQLRFFLSADRKTLACYKRIAHLLHSSAGLARSNSEFALMSWSDTGECVITHARSGALGPPVPGISERAVELGGKFETLPVQHERHQAEVLKNVVPLSDDEAAARYASGWDKVMRSLAEKGKLEIVDEVWYRQSFTMSVVSVVQGMLPWRLERQRPRRVKAILLAGMLVALAGA